jgi:D-tagatose-1,6-bisphosphate aldolase subunit GatZ/KbaZ
MQRILHHLKADHLAGRRAGLYSVCSARREVLTAAIELARDTDQPVLIEATANQVNQFGGYTGMTPEAFASHLRSLAAALGLPRDNLLLGADHLGPYVWRKEPAAVALAKAAELACRCVASGFHKLHLDAAFKCGDDPPQDLALETVAERTAVLCKAAETAAERLPAERPRPLYVIGSEVPIPGGAVQEPEDIEVTRPEDAAEFIARVESRFWQAGLDAAWERLLAVVVQPGVEFGNLGLARYSSEKARPLSEFHRDLPGIMTYEVHSTDYQAPESLSSMVKDHFTLLKVGPCLTHAFREAVFALEEIETECLRSRRNVARSDIRMALERVMTASPEHWRSHYHGAEDELRRLRCSSRLDRIRYYWGHPEVESALVRLHANLSPALPVELIQKTWPDADPPPPDGQSGISPAAFIRAWIQKALRPYLVACR